MNQPKSFARQRVRLDKVTTAREYVACFSAGINSLAAPLDLTVYEGYDHTDDLRFSFLTLKSGETVTLAEYFQPARPGTMLLVDPVLQNVPQIVFDICQQLQAWPEVIWLHPDFMEDIKQLYRLCGQIRQSRPELPEKGQSRSFWREPIDCFHHAVQIYPLEKFPLHWARLQYNLGLAYADRVQGYKLRNLKQSIECFHKSLTIYTQDDFPDKWEMNQYWLQEVQRSLDLLEKQSLVKGILEQPIPDRNLTGVNLSETDLSGAHLSGAKLNGANLNGTELSGADLRLANLRLANLKLADLSGADLSGANLSGTNLSGTNLKFADLSGASLSNANVMGARLNNSSGISAAVKQDLIDRGGIFDDAPGDRSGSKMPVPH